MSDELEDFVPHDFGGPKEAYDDLTKARHPVFIGQQVCSSYYRREDVDEKRALWRAEGRWGRALHKLDTAYALKDRVEYLRVRQILWAHWPARVRYGVTTCVLCGDEVEWPCPTVQEIETEIGYVDPDHSLDDDAVEQDVPGSRRDDRVAGTDGA